MDSSDDSEIAALQEQSDFQSPDLPENSAAHLGQPESGCIDGGPEARPAFHQAFVDERLEDGRGEDELGERLEFFDRKGHPAHRFLFGGFTFARSSITPVLKALAGWAFLEIREGWRTWFNRPEETPTVKQRREVDVRPESYSAVTRADPTVAPRRECAEPLTRMR